MACGWTNAELQTKIDNIKMLILEYEAAELVLAEDPLQSYTIDTGQVRRVLTRFDISSIPRVIQVLENKVATLASRLSGCGSSYGSADW